MLPQQHYLNYRDCKQAEGMPKLSRSPPTTPVPVVEKQLQFSTPIETESSNITSRAKRLRPEFSPDCEWKTFQDKILGLFSDWKSEQHLLFEKLTSEIQEIKHQNTEIQKTNAESLKSIASLNSDYESIKTSLQKLEKENAEQRDYIFTLEKKIVDFERSSRSSRIEIRNVPINEKETTHHLISTVQKIYSTLLPSSNISIEPRDVYRLPGKKGSIRPIVVEFQTVTEKNLILEASRTFNKGLPPAEKLNTGHVGIPGDPKAIYVAEHLSTNLRQLFYEARLFAKNYNFSYCWCSNGKIYLRKADGCESIPVKSPQTIKNLMQIE